MKRAFLVYGPESNGNHLVTDILVNAGCHGDSGNQKWDGPEDQRPCPFEKCLPTTEDPVVLRRSVPYGGRWITLPDVLSPLQGRGYKTTVIVVIRDMFTAMESQLRRRMRLDEGSILQSLKKGYSFIFHQLDSYPTDYILVTYESLVNYPEAQDRLLERLVLPLPGKRVDIHSERNRGYYLRGGRG